MPYNIVFSPLFLPLHASLTILYIIILKNQFSCSLNLSIYSITISHTHHVSFPLTNNHSRHAMHQPAKASFPSEIHTILQRRYRIWPRYVPVSWYCKSRCGISRYRIITFTSISSLGPFFPRPVPSAILTSSQDRLLCAIVLYPIPDHPPILLTVAHINSASSSSSSCKI